MLAAVNAWRDAVIDMVPDVPRGVEASKKIGPRYHHYVFELYALSKMLDLPADATRAQLRDAMKDTIVGKAAYCGRFRQ